jgi:hypothetical protein
MKKKSGLEAFKALFSLGAKLTAAEAIQLSELAAKATELKFLDATVGDVTYRIEGEEVVVGAVVMQVSEDGSEVEVADGELELVVVGFEPIMVTIEGGVITVAAEMLAIEEESPAETELSDEGLEGRLKAIEEVLSPLMLAAKNPRDFKAEFSAIEKTLLDTLKVEMAKVPAMASLSVKQEFSKKSEIEETKDINKDVLSLYSRKKK